MSSKTYGPLLDALRGVRWPARRAVGAALPGTHRSSQRGTSGEFTEYRLYRQGDDPKQLDWKLLARSDRAFVRLTDDRALLPTWFVVDGSASMNFPRTVGDAIASDASVGEAGARAASTHSARVRSKWTVACELTVGLAAVAHASADPVGLLAVGDNGVSRMSARTRQGTVGELARSLDLVRVGGNRDVAPIIASIPVMARVVIISDLLGDGDALLRAAAQRTVAGGIVECVHVVAVEELTLPAGSYLACDPDDRSIARPLDRKAHNLYRERFDAFRADASRRWRGAGAGYREVRTDVVVAHVVRHIAIGAPDVVGITP